MKQTYTCFCFFYVAELSPHKYLCCRYMCACLFITLLFISLPALITFTVFVTQSNEIRAVVYRVNDTVLVTDVRRDILPEKVAVKLSGEIMSLFQSVYIFTTPCDNLTTHNSTVNIYFANVSLDGPVIVMSPTYLVHGSSIEVLVNILDASVINIDISLYIFEGLDEYPNYASHLDKSTYQATVYTSGPGMQNTSTLVNYTIQSTDYYFVVFDSNAPVIAQFHITLYKQLYHESDYKEMCTIYTTGRTECSLSLSKHKCINILAHLADIPDLEQLPVHIAVHVSHPDYLLLIFPAIPSIFCFICCCLVTHPTERKGHKFFRRNNVYTRI